jgi:hypothetical protein
MDRASVEVATGHLIIMGPCALVISGTWVLALREDRLEAGRLQVEPAGLPSIGLYAGRISLTQRPPRLTLQGRGAPRQCACGRPDGVTGLRGGMARRGEGAQLRDHPPPTASCRARPTSSSTCLWPGPLRSSFSEVPDPNHQRGAGLLLGHYQRPSWTSRPFGSGFAHVASPLARGASRRSGEPRSSTTQEAHGVRASRRSGTGVTARRGWVAPQA